MKKIWILLLFVLLMSCNDWLNVESEGDVTYANYFKNEQEVASTVTSMFIQVRKEMASTRLNPLEYAGLYCDELYHSGYKSLNADAFMGKLTFGTSWALCYSIIYFANVLEENRWRFEGITEERTDYWLAQANFMKALMYFRIAQQWGDAPIPKNSENLDPLGKSPVKDVLQQAINSAEKALILPTHEKLTDANGKKVTSKQYASLGTVYTLLANIYAWMGGLYGEATYWEKAEEYATLVIGDGPKGRVAGEYSLEKTLPELIKNVFGSVRQSPEIIFGITYSQADNDYTYVSTYDLFYPGFVLLGYPNFNGDAQDMETGFSEQGDVDARISVKSVKELYTDENDERRKEYWYKLGEVQYADNTYSPYAYLYKWRENTVMEDEGDERKIVAVECNKIVWRLADLILLRAECRARLSRPDAVNDLNIIRNRAGLENYSGKVDMEILRKEIFRERERELIGEGHRYFDVVRNAFYPRDNYYLNRISETYGKLTDADIENGALYMPIRSSAFEKNPYMKQNTYWLWKR